MFWQCVCVCVSRKNCVRFVLTWCWLPWIHGFQQIHLPACSAAFFSENFACVTLLPVASRIERSDRPDFLFGKEDEIVDILRNKKVWIINKAKLEEKIWCTKLACAGLPNVYNFVYGKVIVNCTVVRNELKCNNRSSKGWFIQPGRFTNRRWALVSCMDCVLRYVSIDRPTPESIGPHFWCLPLHGGINQISDNTTGMYRARVCAHQFDSVVCRIRFHRELGWTV